MTLFILKTSQDKRGHGGGGGGGVWNIIYQFSPPAGRRSYNHQTDVLETSKSNYSFVSDYRKMIIYDEVCLIWPEWWSNQEKGSILISGCSHCSLNGYFWHKYIQISSFKWPNRIYMVRLYLQLMHMHFGFHSNDIWMSTYVSNSIHELNIKPPA